MMLSIIHLFVYLQPTLFFLLYLASFFSFLLSTTNDSRTTSHLSYFNLKCTLNTNFLCGSHTFRKTPVTAAAWRNSQIDICELRHAAAVTWYYRASGIFALSKVFEREKLLTGVQKCYGIYA